MGVCVCVLEASCLPSPSTWSVCLCTLSLRKMRRVNPNVSEGEEISDSAEHHVPDFSPSSPYVWPLDALLTASWLTERGEQIWALIEEKKKMVDDVSWTHTHKQGPCEFCVSVFDSVFFLLIDGVWCIQSTNWTEASAVLGWHGNGGCDMHVDCVCVCACRQRSAVLPVSATYTGLTVPA